MRNLKRALSLALAMVMVMSMTLIGANAVSIDDFSDGADIVNKEAVTVLATLGVITGNDDGSYAPADTISRAEMSTIICRVLNGGKDPVLGEAVTNTYTDTASHWAKNYIEYCTTLGIIAGKGDGTFDPEGDVTVAEAAKMVLVALGYNASLEGYTGGNWQINVDARANPIGLYDDLSYTTTNAALTRDNAAQMLYNALDCDMVKYTVVVDATSSSVISTTQLEGTGETLLENKFEAVKVEGIVVANEMANLETSGHLNDERTRILVTNYADQRYYGGAVNSNGDYTVTEDFAISTGLDELGRAVSIYVKKAPNPVNAQVLGSVIVSEDNVVITDYTVDSIADVADDNNLDVDDAQVAVNYGNAVDFSAYDHDEDEVRGVEKILIDCDNDTEVDYVLMNVYRFGKVTSYVTDGDGSISIDLGGNGVETLTEDDAVDVLGFEDVARDDYVIAARIGNRIHVSLAETVTGVLEAYKLDDDDVHVTGLTVDGTDYNTSYLTGYTGGTDDIKAANLYDETYLDNEATFYLTVGGYVAAVGETDESAYRYALVLATGNTGLEDRVRVALSDGTMGTYEISSNSEYDADGSGNDDAVVGTVYRYSLNSSGQIRLSEAWTPNLLTNTTTNASFSQGRTAIRGTGMDTFYATGSTAFFYVGITDTEWNELNDNNVNNRNSIDTEEVDVYTGYGNAPDLDSSLNIIHAVVYTRDDAENSTNAGAVVFYGHDSLVSADVDQSLYISSIGSRNNDYINATAYIAGSTEAQGIQIDINENVRVRHSYTYTINSDGYYVLDEVDNNYVIGGDGDGARLEVDRDSSDTFVIGDEEYVITADTLLVDHSKYLSGPTAELGAGPYQDDLMQWVIFNEDNEVILAVVRNDKINSNAEHGQGNWDEPTNAEVVPVMDTTGDVAAIVDAFRAGKDVIIETDWMISEAATLTIPSNRTLYVKGDLNAATGNTAAVIRNTGRLVVTGSLTTDDNDVLGGEVLTKGWTLTDDNNVPTNGEVTVEGVVDVDTHELTANGTLIADSLTGDTGGKLIVNGHVEIDGNLMVDDVEVFSDDTLIVGGNMTVSTLVVGETGNETKAGKVEVGGNISATTSVTVHKGSIVELTAATGTVTSVTVSVTDATLTANKVEASTSLTISGDATVTVPVVDSSNVDTTGVTSENVSIGTSSESVVTISSEITQDATYAGTVTFANGAKVGADVTLTLNGRVNDIENLAADEGATVVFGANANVYGDTTSYVDNENAEVNVREMANNTFVYDGSKFVVQPGSSAYKMNDTVAAMLDSDKIYA